MEPHNFHKSKLIIEKDIGSSIFRLYENGIYHMTVKKNEKVTMDFVQKGYDFLDEYGGGPFYNIYEFDSFSDVDPEVREWAASPANNSYTYIDAIVISNFPQKILADFYIKINKPVKPTRIFYSLEKAFDWVLSEIDKV